MRGEERRRGGTGERDIDHQLAAVTAQMLGVGSPEQMDLVGAQIVRGDQERETAVGEGSLAERLLQCLAQGQWAVLATSQATHRAGTAAREDRWAGSVVEAHQVGRRQTGREP